MTPMELHQEADTAQRWIKKFIAAKIERKIKPKYVYKYGFFRRYKGWRIAMEAYGRPVYVMEDGRIGQVVKEVCAWYGVHGDYRGTGVHYSLVFRHISELLPIDRLDITRAIMEEMHVVFF